MNIDKYRAKVAEQRRLAPTLYTASGGLDLDTWPGSIQPPEWVCPRHCALWRRWTDYRPYVPIVLMSVGEPLPYEHKRRTAVAEQRLLIAENCRDWCQAETGQVALFDVEEVA